MRRRRSSFLTALFRPGQCFWTRFRPCGSKGWDVLSTGPKTRSLALILGGGVGLWGPFFALPALAGVGQGGPIDLAPHEAVYDLSLVRAEPGGLVSFTGELRYTIENACTGWASTWKMTTTLRNQDGLQLDTRWEFTSYESLDGKNYSFYGRTVQNDQMPETIEGSTVRPTRAGRPLVAVFTAPQALKQPLASDTLFPNAHTISLLKAAREGRSFASGKLFDGGSLGGAILVTSAIGTRLDETRGSVLDHPLLKTPSWIFSMAYFSEPEDGKPGDLMLETPVYEVQGRMHENGVTQDMLQNFGIFSVRARLTSLNALAPVDCGRSKP